MMSRRLFLWRSWLVALGSSNHSPCWFAETLKNGCKYEFRNISSQYIRSVTISVPQWQKCRMYGADAGSLSGDTGNEDLLRKQLYQASTTSQILEHVSRYHNVMNDHHLVQTLQLLFNIERSNPAITRTNLTSLDDFTLLCHLLQKRARYLMHGDIISCVKYLNFLGVQSSTTVMQVLLQLIRKHINEFDLNQIPFLGFIFLQQQDCPLLDALKIALPVVFEAQLDSQMDRDDMRHLVSLLQFSNDYNVSSSAVNKILDAIVDCRRPLDTESAGTILRCLFNYTRPLDSRAELHHKVMSILTDCIDTLPMKQIHWVVAKSFRQHLASRLQYNDDYENFFHAVVGRTLKKKPSLLDVFPIVKRLTTVGYLSFDLLDYLSTRIVEEEEVVLQTKNFAPYVLEVFSIANYKPANIDDIVHIILKSGEIHKENQKLPWLLFTQNLAVLDYYPEKVLDIIFNGQFLRQYLQNTEMFSRFNYNTLLEVYQAVVSLKPDYSGPFPPEDLIQTAIDMKKDIRHRQSFPLLGALERGLGGAMYVKSSLWTKLGQFIDHAVVMRQGCFPVAINHPSKEVEEKKENYVEDIDAPLHSQRVLILVPPQHWYMNNIPRLRGRYTLTIRSLESQGYSVLPLVLSTWQQLMDYEKIPYLMQKIREECESVPNGMTTWGNA